MSDRKALTSVAGWITGTVILMMGLALTAYALTPVWTEGLTILFGVLSITIVVIALWYVRYSISREQRVQWWLVFASVALGFVLMSIMVFSVYPLIRSESSQWRLIEKCRESGKDRWINCYETETTTDLPVVSYDPHTGTVAVSPYIVPSGVTLKISEYPYPCYAVQTIDVIDASWTGTAETSGASGYEVHLATNDGAEIPDSPITHMVSLYTKDLPPIPANAHVNGNGWCPRTDLDPILPRENNNRLVGPFDVEEAAPAYELYDPANIIGWIQGEGHSQISPVVTCSWGQDAEGRYFAMVPNGIPVPEGIQITGVYEGYLDDQGNWYMETMVGTHCQAVSYVGVGGLSVRFYFSPTGPAGGRSVTHSWVAEI